ncbi:MAG: hypothetical protein WKF37_05915 [Bryobacteraceae bacterium]
MRRIILAVLAYCFACQGAVRTVCNAGPPACLYSDLQRALDEARGSDIVELKAGDIFTTASGFILPPKGFGDSITVRGSQWMILQPGRITPDQSVLLPKIVATKGVVALRTGPVERLYTVNPATDTFVTYEGGLPSGAAVSFARDLTATVPLPGGLEPSVVYYVISVQGNSFKLAATPNGRPIDITAAPTSIWSPLMQVQAANNYQIDGIEITVLPGVFTFYLVQIGNSAANRIEQVPDNVTMNRVYIHGVQGENGPRHCLYAGAKRFSLSNSYLSECKDLYSDSTALVAFNGTGPYTITNNYFEGATENVLFGGASINLIGSQIRDVTFTGNYVRKKLEWRWGMSPDLTSRSKLTFRDRTGRACSEAGSNCFMYTPAAEKRIAFKAETSVAALTGTGSMKAFLTEAGRLTIRYGPSARMNLRCSAGVQCEPVVAAPIWPANVTRLHEWDIANGAFAASGTKHTFIQKVLFEIKQGSRFQIENNVLENQWNPDAGSYCSLLFTPRTESGLVPQAAVSHVLFTRNIVRHVNCGISITGSDDDTDGRLGAGGDISLTDNLFEDISWRNNGFESSTQGVFLRGGQGFTNVNVENNTITNLDGPLMLFIDDPGAKPSHLNLRRNIVVPGDSAGFFPHVIGNSTVGWTDCKRVFNPAGVMESNIVLNSNGVSAAYLEPRYPIASNFGIVPAKTIADVLFVNYRGGDYRLCAAGIPGCAGASPF